MFFLDKFWKGDVAPGEGRYHSRPEYSKALHIMEQCDDTLKAHLSQEDYQVFREYAEASLAAGCKESCDNFIDGFRLGARMILLVLQAEFHILPNGQMGENCVILEDHSDVSLGGIQIIDTLITEIKIATLSGIKAGDHSEQSGLSATGGTQQREEFAFLDFQIQIWNNNILVIFLQCMLNGYTFFHE